MSLPFKKARKWTGGGSSGGGGRPVAGRLRVVDRHYQDDNGWFPWYCISDLSAVAWVLNGGREQSFRDRVSAYQRQSRNMVRGCGMLGWNAPDGFSPDSPGYWDALDRTYHILLDADQRFELCIFADAQIVVPDKNKRKQWMAQFGDFIRQRPGIVPQCANEAFKNGWSDCDDPELLELAEILADKLGHRDFSISDPAGEQGEGGAKVRDKLVLMSQHSNICVVHPDRSQHGDQTRYRRWVDHLEGFVDVISAMKPGTALALDEPMGAGPQYIDGKRDNDPDALLAGQLVGLCCKLAYTYHWIVGEGLDANNLPGMQGDLITRLPVSPDWRYLNDSWQGAPTEGINWWGKPGKMRNLVNGHQAWTVAYGEGDWNSVKWRAGWTPHVEYQTQRCSVWTVT